LVSNLQPSTFIAAIAREVNQHYAAVGTPPRGQIRSRLAQFWWGQSATIHYEVWIHERTLQLELGLHFEASADRNDQLFQRFGPHLLEIQQELGDSVWLEEWDKGWTRIYETQPLFPMDEARVYAVAGRLCEIIDCLQPILDSFDA
jgi:5-carboxymethyl-2-hydroxymuconate isomerase